MSDAAFKTGAYPGYTTDQLRKMMETSHLEVKMRMSDEILRRERVAAGDVSVMTPGERLRFYRTSPEAAH
jgi:hypothetical protein